ncbi:uncharacterized protein LOC129918153 [Episyrphus balteatus]|uniref:uncharacterized protein LOC129918153 n=1 Tax=Episyrphus balteatus TaxID=286459 RepID=UPI002485B58F|nr:uncharacterized protein LOC129918153 [Episyrphus balteatus]
MAALPRERTELSLPFANTGIDFAGPFSIKSFSARNCRITKGYVCLFVCFATKAIHLEPTSDLSTSAFLAAFSRFVARRGLPKTIFSDNGTNFVGASKVLANDFRLFIDSFARDVSGIYQPQGVNWKFIPPGAPHMGGLWEAGVKSFKAHFRKVAGQNKFTFEEFTTLLARIKSCLNSRPLIPLTDNIIDILPLTPGHFLRGAPLLAPPEPDMTSTSLSLSNRWKKVKILHHNFCLRWKEEYLKELQKRYKWKYSKRDIALNDLVVIREENVSCNEWLLGRIVKLYTGSDGRVRVADVKTQKGILKRPIVKLCILLRDEEENTL